MPISSQEFDILEHFNRLEDGLTGDRTEVPTSVVNPQREPTTNSNKTLADAKTVIDNMTEPSPVAKAIGDKINSFVASFVTFDPPRFGSSSETRPESTATTQDFLALLSEEEQKEFNRLVNSPK